MKLKEYITLLLISTIICACNTKEYQIAQGKIYGTFYTIQYDASTDMQMEIRQEMEKINASLSMFAPNSIISNINNNTSDSTDLLFRRMYKVALDIYNISEGYYDITVGPLVNLWGFGTQDSTSIDSIKIIETLSYVGMNKIQLINNKLIKQNPLSILDASSIAKGLGIDLVAEFLDKQGIDNYLVDIGGEVRVKGLSPKQRPWQIGIERPQDCTSEITRNIQMILALSEGSIATSGNYHNYYIKDGKKYAHTINPQTGYPIQTEILSASVYSNSCMLSDAYATAFMTMGLEKSLKIITTTKEIEACIIYTENGELKIWKSQGIEKMLLSN